MRSFLRLTLLFLFFEEGIAQTPWQKLWTAPVHPATKQGAEGGLWKSASGKNAETRGLTIRAEGNDLLVFRQREGLDTLLLRPEALDLDSGWGHSSHLAAELDVPDPRLVLHLGFQGPRGSSEEAFPLKSGRQVVRVSLEALPMTGLPESCDRPAFLRFRWEGKARNLRIRRLFLVREPGWSVVRVDSFGQRKKGTWPGKTRMLPRDPSPTDAGTWPAAYSRFGGWTGKDRMEARGVFYVRETKGGWTLVDPEGHPFWSQGVTGVRISAPGFLTPYTRVSGREALFEKLPPDSLRHGDKGQWIQYYHWNVLRRYGSRAAWRNQTAHRLRDWGFNTLGNWSDPIWFQKPLLPYTYTLRTNLHPRLRLANGLPDVFHPDWAHWVDSAFAHIAAYKPDSFLLGYFVDNEFHWLELEAAAQSPESHCFAVQQALLARGLGADSFRAAYARRYFSVVQAALRRYDPRHLYLGCRFLSRVRFPEIIREAGRWCDVVSVNIYQADPAIAQTWHTLSGKPILVGEFHIPLASERQVPPLYPVFPEPERSRMVARYLEACRAMPFLVGAHWYQYADQPLTGREGNGENQTIGLVDVCDTPYPELIKVFRAFSASGLYDMVRPPFQKMD